VLKAQVLFCPATDVNLERSSYNGDYFMKEPGIWAGRGAERLGLRGPVERSQFVALLRNENPTTGKRLTARMNTSRQEDGESVTNRQVGYGLVFGVPKSLSIYLAEST
jgi:conjugative relaxase-like TrwC/TraI family protein